MNKLPQSIHRQLVNLRMNGKSIPEISRETGIAKTTVQRHIKSVVVPEKFREALKQKQGGSKQRAAALREHITNEARALVGAISKRDLLLLLVALYWGEGTKRDFSIINSDPALIQTFICSLRAIGISKERLSISIRTHTDVAVTPAKVYWARTIGMPLKSIKRVEIIEGKKKGKLPYGMCRVRVISGIRDRLLIQSIISLIGKDCRERVVSS
ncbi:hypothetical protein K2Y00_01440 [Patescibacteria group bacterium]|nr:hypothetical protein [Patescibacteria group bacterium]